MISLSYKPGFFERRVRKALTHLPFLKYMMQKTKPPLSERFLRKHIPRKTLGFT